MGTDFNSYRFDFRLDSISKTGPPPGFCLTTVVDHAAETSSPDQAAAADSAGARCSTLYSCKLCGCLLRSRSDRKKHVTLAHGRGQRTYQRQPGDQSVLLLGLRSSLPLVIESSVANHPTLSSSELAAVDFDFLRSSFVPQLHQSSESLTPSTDISLQTCDVDTQECRPAVTSSSICFRSSGDDIGPHYGDTTSGIVSTSRPFDKVSSSSKVLDLTALQATGESHSELPVLSRDVAHNSDLWSFTSAVRQRKSRVLNLTIQKLWQYKLQREHSVDGAYATDESITFRDFETSLARSNSEKFVRSSDQRSDEDGGFETAVCDVTNSRSRGHGQARTELMTLRRLVADHTSLMRQHSTCRRKPHHKRSSREAVNDAPSTSLDGPRCSPQTADGCRTSKGRGSHVVQGTCRVCRFEAEDGADLRSHMLATHGHEIEELRAAHLCTKCGRRFRSKTSLAHHVNTISHQLRVRHHPSTLRCRRLQMSLQRPPDNSRQAIVESRSRETLSGTSGTCAVDGRVTCEFPGCRREFRELKHLKVHRMQHTDERPLACALCTYSCRQRNSLNWHMKSRHGLDKSVTDDGRTVYVCPSPSANDAS